MVTYYCNYCKKPINFNEKNCVHFKIAYGKEAITSMGRYGDGWDGDLCEECFMKLQKSIDVPYYGGGNYLEQERRKTADSIIEMIKKIPMDETNKTAHLRLLIKNINKKYGGSQE